MRKISAHSVDLPFDGVARYSSFGPAFRNHRADPHVLSIEQAGDWYEFLRLIKPQGRRFDVERVAVQYKVRCFCNNGTCQDRLKLSPGFKTLHWRPTSTQKPHSQSVRSKAA